MKLNLEWFREQIIPHLEKYSWNVSSFENGDFGDMDRIELENDRLMICVEFWENGYIGFTVFDKLEGDLQTNVLVTSNEWSDQKNEFTKLIQLMGA